MGRQARILYDYPSFNYDTPATRATVTASSQMSSDTGPLKALFDRTSYKWWANGKTAEWIKFDLGSAKQITCFGIFAHNLSAAATVFLQANSSDSWTSPPYNQALTIPTNADGVALPRLVFFLNQTFRWWRLTLDNPTNPVSRLSIGRIIAGTYYEFDDVARGARITYSDPSPIIKTPGGVEIPDGYEALQRFRLFRIEIPRRTHTDLEKWDAIFTKIGNSKPCVLALDPTTEPSLMSGYCYLESDLDIAWQMNDRYDLLTMVFAEKVR